ncbi:MAG: hypothetical protein ABA06_02815 [Parcubacteria bacterium C7867-001]|nr:MAG: hypothetical protein ABA06_02815 [Parcubacteria bacterium C7867-001]
MSTRRRIGNLTGNLLLTVAGALDGVQFLATFIPFVDVVVCFLIGAIANFLFYLLWFPLIDPSIIFGKKQAPSKEVFKVGLVKWAVIGGTALLELIPFVDMIPAITFGVASTIFFVRLEDAGIMPKSFADTISLATSAKRRREALRAVITGGPSDAPAYQRAQERRTARTSTPDRNQPEKTAA